MSAYSNPPKTHLRNPRIARTGWTTCGLRIIFGGKTSLMPCTHDYKEVTCKSCKRTNIYRMKRMGVRRPDWKEDE